MGILTTLPARALAKGWVLAPERYDPSRRVKADTTVLLQDLYDVVTENVSPRKPPSSSILVLDTTHAQEGFVLFRHAPGAPGDMGSAKRLLRPRDVIISRLRPYLRQVAFVDEALFSLNMGGNAVVASTEYYVLRARGELPTAALVPYLLCDAVQEALAAAQEGGHHPRFGKETLATLPMPTWFTDTAQEAAEQVVALANTVRASMTARDDLIATASARQRFGPKAD